MCRKLLGLTCFAIFSVVNAQSPQPAPSTPQSNSRLEALSKILNIDKTRVTFSSYYERFDYASSANADYDWWTAFLAVYLESTSVNGFSLGAELAAHMEIYDDNQERYHRDIEDDAKGSLSLLYLQYEQDGLLARLGRIDRMGTHLDDNRYEGLIGKYTMIENRGSITKLDVLAGAIRSWGEIDYDDGEELTHVTSNNGGEAADYVVFTEAKATIAKMVDINPFLYYQDDYAGVIGIDNKITWGDDVKVGGILNYNEIDSKVGGYNDAENYDIGIFTEIKSGKSTVFIQAGTTEMDGADAGNTTLDPAEQRAKPNWFRDYMTRSDQLHEYHEDALTYYLYTKAISEIMGKKCWGSIYLAEIEYAGGADVEGVEFQVGCYITKKLDLNIRYFIYERNVAAGEDYQKVEARLQYKF